MLRRYLLQRPLSHLSRLMLLLTVAVTCGAMLMLWLSHTRLVQQNQHSLENFKSIHNQVEHKLTVYLPQHLLLQELLTVAKEFEFELTLVVFDHSRGDMQLHAIHHHLQKLHHHLRDTGRTPTLPNTPRAHINHAIQERNAAHDNLLESLGILLDIGAEFFSTPSSNVRQQLLRDVVEPIQEIHTFIHHLAVTQEQRFAQLTRDNRQQIHAEISNIEDIQAYLRQMELTLLAVFSIALGLIVLLQMFFYRVLHARLQQLGNYATAIAEGKFDTAMRISVADDTGRLADVMQYMAGKLRHTMRRYQEAVVTAEEAQQAAERANHSKSAFIADVSHELRTPLNGILGYTQLLLRDSSLSDKQRQGIQIIDKSGTHLLSLINDILDMAKMEAGKIELYSQDFNLASFLQDIVELLTVRARDKHILFHYDVCDNLPIAVHADPKRLRQVLINLLGNAVKFTRHGSVTLQICLDAQQRMKFSVADTGVGIATNELASIFMPFKQAGNSSQRHEGTGLGLSISKNLVAQMGGELHVESTLGQGSRFWFVIRLPEADNPQFISDDEINNISGYRILADAIDKYRILVVDDQPETSAMVKGILEPLGFDIIAVADSTQALSVALAQRPHLVMMDLIMPAMNGFQVSHQFKQHPELKHIPIIANSASVFDTHRQRSIDAGCVEFLAKPLQIKELLNCLQNHLALKWQYGMQAKIIAPVALNIPGPKPAQAYKIYELADKGYISEILDYIDELETEEPALQPFLKNLRQYAEAFDDEAVRHLVQAYILPPATNVAVQSPAAPPGEGTERLQ